MAAIGTPEELARVVTLGQPLYWAFCHRCGLSGLYYGKETTPEGFVQCVCQGDSGKDEHGLLDLMPIGPVLLRRGKLICVAERQVKYAPDVTPDDMDAWEDGQKQYVADCKRKANEPKTGRLRGTGRPALRSCGR